MLLPIIIIYTTSQYPLILHIPPYLSTRSCSILDSKATTRWGRLPPSSRAFSYTICPNSRHCPALVPSIY